MFYFLNRKTIKLIIHITHTFFLSYGATLPAFCKTSTTSFPIIFKLLVDNAYALALSTLLLRPLPLLFNNKPYQRKDDERDIMILNMMIVLSL